MHTLLSNESPLLSKPRFTRRCFMDFRDSGNARVSLSSVAIFGRIPSFVPYFPDDSVLKSCRGVEEEQCTAATDTKVRFSSSAGRQILRANRVAAIYLLS
jgi:hypothetical protein